MRFFRWLGNSGDDVPRVDDPAVALPTRRPVILVVEDQPPIRRLVVRALAADEPVILEASNGEEAVTVVERHPEPVDLLVTDIDMPVMDGHKLVDLLHPRCPTMKVLFVSGIAGTLFETRAVLPDWAAYLDKPVTPQSLREAASLVLYGTTRAFGAWRSSPPPMAS